MSHFQNLRTFCGNTVLVVLWALLLGVCESKVAPQETLKTQVFKARVSAFPYKRAVEHVEIKQTIWTGDLKAALDDSRKKSRLVFIAFVGATDVNSMRNHDVFSQTNIRKALGQFTLVMLYID